MYMMFMINLPGCGCINGDGITQLLGISSIGRSLGTAQDPQNC